jgi:hypothetical protein
VVLAAAVAVGDAFAAGVALGVVFNAGVVLGEACAGTDDGFIVAPGC